jgi:protease IV
VGLADNRHHWFIGLVIGLVSIVAVLWMAGKASKGKSSETVRFSSGGGNVGIVELLGPIYDSERIVHQFETFGEQKSIKAIVFRIDSPGGLVAPSQEIYEAVKRVRDGGKPVVVSMGSVAASGGYYAACGSDTIMANPGTTTGSIGVVAEFLDIQKLMEKIGVRFETVKSGKFKDTGSPHRELTDDDRAYLQSWIDDAFEQFVGVVSAERGLTKAEVLKLADGRAFTGRQAMALGLVDTLGDYRAAIHLAGLMGKIKGEPELVRWHSRRITLFDLLFQDAEGVFRQLNGARLFYRMP